MSERGRERNFGFSDGTNVDAGSDPPADAGYPDEYESEGVDSTRAMSTPVRRPEPPRQPPRPPAPAPMSPQNRPAPPPPQRPAAPPPRPAAPPPRPAAPPPRPAAPPPRQPGPPQGRRPAPPPEDDNEQSTRMMDAFDDAPPPPRGEPKPTFKLKVVAGPDRGKVHNVASSAMLVGRGLDCQIVLADPSVSRKHFQVMLTPQGLKLQDLGGANGTRVNGQRVREIALNAGDRIEAGTSICEVVVEGLPAPPPPSMDDMVPVGGGAPPRGLHDPTFRGPAHGAPGRPAQHVMREPPPSSSKKGLIIGGAVGGVVVVGAILGVIAFSGGDSKGDAAKDKDGKVVSSTSTTPTEGDELKAKNRDKAIKLLQSGKERLAGGDAAGALDDLREAKKKDPALPGLDEALERAEAEAKHEEALQEGRRFVEEKRYDIAFERLSKIPSSSASYQEAQGLISEARDKVLKNAQDLAEKGQNAEALKAAEQVLKIDANNAEAKALKASLAGEAGAPPDKAADKPPEKAPEPAVADKGGALVKVEKTEKVDKTSKIEKGDRPDRGTDKGSSDKGGDAKAEFGPGLSQYHQKKFAQAAKYFEDLGGRATKKEKTKAMMMAAAAQEVGRAWADADSKMADAARAVDPLKRAYGADQRVDGYHGKELSRIIASRYGYLAKAAMAKRSLGEAARKAREALKYAPGDSEAKSVLDRCVEQVPGLLAAAKDALARKNTATARDKARQVIDILPPSDGRVQEARTIERQASSAADDDED